MKFIPKILRAVVGGLGLRYANEWPHNYTGADVTLITILSALYLIAALVKINDLLK